MNESTKAVVDKIFPDERASLIRFFMHVTEMYPHASIESFERLFEDVLQEYVDGNPDHFSTQYFATLWAELWYTNNVRKESDSERGQRMCDKLEKFLLGKLHEELNPIHFSRNYRDLGFVISFFILCNYNNLPEPNEDFTLSWWAEENCEDKKAALLPHIETPFIAMLIRYTWYNHLLDRYENDEEYRLKCYTLEHLDFSTITKVEMGNYSRREVCEQYALSHNCGLRDIADERVRQVKMKADIPGHWYLTLIEKEALHLKNDEKFLKTIFKASFVSSLMNWHNNYFNYLIECLRSYDEFKEYPIENLLPPAVAEKLKLPIINDHLALTPLGEGCRQKGIIERIEKCRTAADYGALLYKFQFELGYFTKDKLSRNEYYIFMQQIAKVKFCPCGDYSNCNKGFNKARVEASKS